MNLAPGLYHYRRPDWSKSVVVEVTDTHVRFSRERRPVPLDQIPADAIVSRVTIEDYPKVPEQLFIITSNGPPIVAAPILGPTPRMPSEILDLYAEQYGIERKGLSWAVVQTIPMPVPPTT